MARLLSALPAEVERPALLTLTDKAKVLDTYYIPTRYPDSHPEGPPFEHYGSLQGRELAREIFACVHDEMAPAGNR